MRYRVKRKCVVAAVRIPEDLYIIAQRQMELEDLDFSKLVRRAIRKELAASGIDLPKLNEAQSK